MPSTNNIIILDGCISEYRENNELEVREDELFELFTVAQLTRNYELSFEDVNNSVVDGGRDGGIDAFVILLNDKAISSEDQLSDFEISASTTLSAKIIQSKTERNHTEATLDKLITSSPLLYDLSIDEDELLARFNASLVEKIVTFRKAWMEAVRKGANIKIEYSYVCKANEVEINQAFESKIDQLKSITEEKVSNAEVTFDTDSAKELVSLYHKTKPSQLEIEFKEAPTSVTYDDEQIGYLGVVTLANYYKFVVDEEGNVRENIFESNIRDYQGDVDVNENIRETLRSDLGQDFWWLNNGITIIASRVGQIGKKLTLENVQIVNGLQTSYSIGKYFEPIEGDERSILTKVIINEDKETIDKIISATNRQNAVSPTLLRATDELQKTIELFFLEKGYFYDRRKNYYKNQGKPASKIFSIQFTAQSIEAIMNFNPAEARSKPTTLIKDDRTYTKIFRRDVDFNAFVNSCLIAQKTQNFIKSLDRDDRPVARNFTYHLARIAASLVINKAHYDSQELASLDPASVDDDTLNQSFDVLTNQVGNYQKDNPGENIINISKSKKFSEGLNETLRDRFE